MEMRHTSGGPWDGTDNLLTVQQLLDKNKLLIAEIHQNHDTRTAASLQRNTQLIRELNSNISKVGGWVGGG